MLPKYFPKLGIQSNSPTWAVGTQLFELSLYPTPTPESALVGSWGKEIEKGIEARCNDTGHAYLNHGSTKSNQALLRLIEGPQPIWSAYNPADFNILVLWETTWVT